MAYDNKLAGMILLLTNENKISRTALNKHLFFADIASFLKSGQQISNVHYVKLDYGPVPELIETTRDWLLDSGLLSKSIEINGPYIQHSYKCNLSDAELKQVSRLFTEDDASILTATAENLKPLTATKLSDISHEFEPWKSSPWYEVMDFQTANDDQKLRDWLQDKNILTN